MGRVGSGHMLVGREMIRVEGMVVRSLVVGACVAAILGGCTQTDSASSISTSISTSTTIAPTTQPDSTTSSTVPPTTTPATTTTSTTTTYPPGLMVLAGPLDGEFVREQIDYSVWGDVRPEATVTVNSVDTSIEALPETIWGHGWHRWSTPEDPVPEALALEPGVNTILSQAVFTDGTTLVEERTFTFDPTLRRETGYMLGLTLSIPLTATLVYATLEYDEWGLYQVGDASPPVEVPIAPDAAFIVLHWRPPESRVRDLTEFAELAVTASIQGEVEEAWFGQLFPAPGEELDWATAAPWEFLINQAGELQQAYQLYTP